MRHAFQTQPDLQIIQSHCSPARIGGNSSRLLRSRRIFSRGGGPFARQRGGFQKGENLGP